MGIDYNPWNEVHALVNQLDRWFLQGQPNKRANAFPRVNAWNDESKVVISAEVPGLAAEDLEVIVEAEKLTIAGETRREATADEVNWHRAERAPGKFRRQFVLPFRVDPDAVSATCNDGILTLELKRCAAEAPRQISVVAG